MTHTPTAANLRLPLACALFFALAASPQAAELHGRVTDVLTKKSVTGAVVSLVPAAGETLTARTGAFGFYTLTNIPSGDFTLQLRHAAYQPHDEPFTTTAPATSATNVELVPRFPTEAQVDLLVDVTDTRAGKPLPNIPVRIQRFSLADPNSLEETTTPFTDASGKIQLPGFRPGHYTFRFNHPADGSRVPFYQPLDISAKSRLGQPHAVHAQLLPDSQQMVVRVLGPDPARPDDGEVPLAGVAVDLTGVSETLDPSYNPFEDALIDVVTEILPTRTAVTDADGKITFKNLPPITYLIEAKKHGYLRSEELRGPDPGSLALPFEHEQHLVLDPDTTTELFFTSPYPDPAVMTGLQVTLEGIPGSNTGGITREVTALEFEPDATFPLGAMRAEFPGLLPGRYRASVDQTIPTPDTYTVNVYEFANIDITFRGGRCFDVAQGVNNSETIKLDVVPATVRGRFLVADEPRRLSFGTTAGEYTNPGLLDAVYKPRAQSGIQLTQSFASFLLPFDLAVVSVESDADGNFSASVLPSAWGVEIPTMTGYWGANQDLLNLSTGDRASRGWPYPVFPFQIPPPIPTPPFGSLGIPLHSGQDYQLTLYVRRQVYNIRGSVPESFDNPLAHRILSNSVDPPITVDFSEVINGGLATMDYQDGTIVHTDLVPSTSQTSSIGSPIPGGAFEFLVPPGTHTLTYSHPWHTFRSQLTGATSTEVNITTGFIPDLFYPGIQNSPQVIPLSDVFLPVPGGGDFDLVDTADYAGQDFLSIDFYRLDDEEGRVFSHSLDKPHVVVSPDYPGVQFAVNQFGQFRMKQGTWEFWVKQGEHWYHATVVATNQGTTYVVEFNNIDDFGGFSNPPPAKTYNLHARAVLDSDPTFHIEGLNINFDNGDGPDISIPTPASGFGTHAQHQGEYTPLSVSPSTKWLPAVGPPTNPNSYTVEVDTTGTKPDVYITLRMKRGMGISGTVLAAVGANTPPLADVDVNILQRYGSRLTTARTGGDGSFQIDPALSHAQPVFIEVNVPGYFPYLQRFSPADGEGEGQQLDIVADIKLTPLPLPTVTAASFDRKGTFLPGVTKSSSGSVLADDPDITTTFTVDIAASNVVFNQTQFDNPDGVPQLPVPQNLPDKIRSVWIVDPRWFADDPFLHDPKQIVPGTNNPGMLTAPSEMNPLFPVFMRDLLDKIQHPEKLLDPPDPSKQPRTFYYAANNITETAPGMVRAQGSFSLADLPPGPLKPWAIARTDGGTFRIFEIKFAAAEDFKNLYGINLPPWAAAVADTLGTTAALQGELSKVKLDQVLPAGFVEALPGFTGEITKDTDGFLTYTYGVNAKIAEGMDMPGFGFLAMAPGFNGFDVSGALDLVVAGKSPEKPGSAEVSLGGEVVASTTVVGIEEFIPKSLSKKARRVIANTIRQNASASLVIGGSAKLETSFRTVGSHPLDIEVESTTTGGIGLPIEIDLTPFVQTIPTVGQVVTILAEAPTDSSLLADIDAAIGTSVKRSFTTTFPHLDTGTVAGFGSSDLNPLSPRQHFLGGARDNIDIKVGFEQAYCLRFGVGLTAQLGSGRLGARGHLTLAGNQCRIPTAPGGGFQPALKFTRNPHSDWPPISRIQGNLTGGITAFLDLWIKRFEKSWEWELLRIDVQLNSDAVFTLTPLTIEERSSPVLGGDAIDWVGLPPTLINRYYTPSDFTVSSDPSGNLALVFTDLDPLTGNMVLKIATRTGDHTWSDPVTVTTAPGIVTTAVHPLPAGGWIAVWSELDITGTTNPFPTSALKFATSADATTWSAPDTIATCGGVAADLRLLDMGSGNLGLVFLESLRGPVSQTFDVSASLFSAGAWGPCQLVAPDQVVRAWDAAGPGPAGTAPAEIAGLDNAGNLATTTWDGTTVGTPSLLLAGSGNTTLDLAAGPGHTFFLATGNPASGIQLFAKSAPGSWTSLGSPLPGVRPRSLTLTPTDDGTDQRLALAFTTGADTTAVHFAFLDTAGTVVRPVDTLLTGGAGLYRNLAISPRPGTHTASLFTIFEGPGLDQLRTFDLDTTTGQNNPDRDNDTLPDTEELRIVDADPDDTIHDIDDVHAADDFDQDTATNGTEINAGTDPTDPHSFPGQLVQLFSDVPECFEFGTVPATFNFTRGGDTSQPLTIHYTVSGTASAGTDFPALAGQLTLAPGITHHPILVSPFGDTDAEGEETIILTLTPDAAYTIGTSNAATATVNDLPMDGWRFTNFTTAELADPEISGDNIDLEKDSLDNLLEYAFGRNPKSPDTDGLPVAAIIENGGEQFAALVFVHPLDAEDLFYDIQASTDLDNTRWVSLTPDQYEIVSTTDNGDGTETVVIRDLVATDTVDARFLRLRIERLTGI